MIEKQDKKQVEFIIRQLRAAFLISQLRNDCINRYREHRVVGNYQNGNTKYKYFYPCAHCKEFFENSEVLECDHIEEIGSFWDHENWDIYVRRMWCDQENLQALCTICHQRKTSNKNSSLRFERKQRVLIDNDESEEVIEGDLL